ncbi:MAG TPA: quinone oxidoreductase [Steroidobacter sp.]|jgi:NADPH2:quinone reductase|nr:quinone oxidoreductase [Steroidobacteraceae bacterium]HLS80897.1 quinone oxidoreductase [Steroidobacter sp.]
MHAIRIREYGGPEVLRWEPLEVGEPGRGEVRVRHTAVGLNFIDVYERTGLYRGELPLIPGHEAAGVIEAVGPGVSQVRVGDRVAYASQSAGAYCEARVMSTQQLVPIPDGVDDRQAAAIMLKGLTAQALLRQVHRLRKGEAILIHAAAGGVGSILVQWARRLGAQVIAVVGSEEKAQLARELGADHVLLEAEDWAAQAKAVMGGRGVHVVYDSVGRETFFGSLDCLRPRGLMVSYGNASGPVQPFAPLELSKRGSLFLTRPTVFDYVPTRAALLRAARELFDLIASGAIRIRIGQTYPLHEAEHAHRELAARRTTGSTVLLPSTAA